MGRDKRSMERNRARRLARLAARKKARKKQQAQAGPNRFAYMGVTRAELGRAPIYRALVSDTILGAEGIGNVIISRLLPDGRVAAGVFLVDSGCLGVKDAFFTVLSPSGFDEKFGGELGGQTLEPKPPAYARKLIEDALAYARNLGIEPHADFAEASVVLGDIDPAACSDVFTFGKDGKPFYASGPHDTEERIQYILATLRAHCGNEGFDYLIVIRDPEQTERLGLSGSRTIFPDGTELPADDSEVE